MEIQYSKSNLLKQLPSHLVCDLGNLWFFHPFQCPKVYMFDLHCLWSSYRHLESGNNWQSHHDQLICDWNRNKFRLNNKGIHLYLPQYCERNSCHIVKIFLLSSGVSGQDCDSHLKGKSKNLKYVRVPIFSQILDILVVYSIQFFISISKI